MRRITILSVALLVVTVGLCRADTTEELAKENTELRKRVDKLEKEVEELRKIVLQKADVRKEPVEAKVKSQDGTASKLDEAELQKIADMVRKEKGKKTVWSNLDIQLYGYIKLDAAYDTSRIDNGNYSKWVQSEATNRDDDQFNMTANQTRLGLKIFGPDDGNIKTSGRIEIDFFGGGAENKSQVMMRHAYMKIDWPDKRFNIIAGQTSDVISPLYPDTLNYSVGWWAGNIGYRRPQIRLTKSFMLNDDVDVKLEGALARTIGVENQLTPKSESGEDSGLPGVQARVGAKFPFLREKKTELGISGHWAKEEYDTTPSGGNDKFDSWSLNFDLTQPINEWLSIKGEFFTGENLSAYLGGIGQGIRNINTATTPPIYDKEIGSKGGWVAAGLGPWDKWRFTVGASVDDADNDDLSGVTNRELNRSIFGNAIYSINKNTEVGFELSQWHTEYVGQRNADSLRGQTSFIYKF